MRTVGRQARIAGGTLAACLAASMALAGAALATTYTVTTNADTGAGGTLRGAIGQVDNSPFPSNVINIDSGLGTITLSSDLWAITNNVTINGNGNVIDGAGSYRGLFVYAGTVAINDLTVQNATAQGGIGGTYDGGGGAVDLPRFA